jgi:NADH:ubiquinone oxidoreductase subunit K
MRFLLGIGAILLAAICYVVFGHWWRNVVGKNFALIPITLAERPAECAVYVGTFFVASVLLTVGIVAMLHRDRPN